MSMAPDIVAGVGQPLMELLYPNYLLHNRTMPTTFQVWKVEDTNALPVKEASTGTPLQLSGSYNVGAMTSSRDSMQLVAIGFADHVPQLWERYSVPPVVGNRSFRSDRSSRVPVEDYSRALQYQLLDLKEGDHRPLLAAPVADFQHGGVDRLQAVWSPDGRHVAVTGTYLPLDQRASTRPCAVAVVDTQRDDLDCLIDRSSLEWPPVSEVSWTNGGRRLLVRPREGRGVEFERRGTHWQLSAHHPVATTPPLDVMIEQSLNQPPVLVAKAHGTHQAYTIFDPNPWLTDVALGTVTLYSWTDVHGRSIEGGLAKPPDFVPGKHYPLVIQTHNFRPRRFFRVGTSETSSAGRALAGRGMLVLQVDEPDDHYMGSWEEASENGTQVYLAAIDQLVAEGLVDPHRVGITGYSKMGFYVAKAITDAPDRFAAVVVANADPGSLIGYDTYIDYVMPSYAKGAAEFFAGALPYGEGLQHWLERAPGFRTDRIRAPVLISAADPQHLISLWGFYAPLRDQGKPVELQYIRGGQHNIVKPLEKLAHQEMLVDWFDFWLNGHEDPDSTKVEQYTRWHKLREQVSQ